METQVEALSLLRLHLEWGVDEALEDAPVNRLTVAPPPAARLAPTTPSAALTTSPAETALALAGRADSLDALRAAIEAAPASPLRDAAGGTVFWAGDPSARVLLIGDPPSQDDERAGTPFAGQNGAYLDAMLAVAGLRRDSLLLAPLLPWRPVGGRPASAGDLQLCLPFLHRLIALTDPALLVVAGAQASRAVLGPRVRADAGTGLVTVPGAGPARSALILPFPAQSQRLPAARREAWAALRRLRRFIDAL